MLACPPCCINPNSSTAPEASVSSGPLSPGRRWASILVSTLPLEVATRGRLVAALLDVVLVEVEVLLAEVVLVAEAAAEGFLAVAVLVVVLLLFAGRLVVFVLPGADRVVAGLLGFRLSGVTKPCCLACARLRRMVLADGACVCPPYVVGRFRSASCCCILLVIVDFDGALPVLVGRWTCFWTSAGSSSSVGVSAGLVLAVLGVVFLGAGFADLDGCFLGLAAGFLGVAVRAGLVAGV